MTTVPAPDDAAARRAIKPVICYDVETLPAPDMGLYQPTQAARVGEGWTTTPLPFKSPGIRTS